MIADASEEINIPSIFAGLYLEAYCEYSDDLGLGGVYFYQNITLDLNGHVLSSFFDSGESAVTIGKKQPLTLTDSNPTAARKFTVDDNGLYCWDETFTSQVSSRLKTDDDGIYFWDDEATTVTVKGGCITGAARGQFDSVSTLRTIAGVYNNGGTFNMYAGTIMGNSGDIGGGVYNQGTMTVGGKAAIEGNTVYGTDTAQNVYLTSGTKITVSTETPFVTGANIGVTTETKPTAGSPVSFTTNGATTDEAYFFSDILDYADKYYNEGKCLDLILGYRVTVKDCENGTISVGNQKSAYDGEPLNVTVTPDEGYELDTLTYTPVDESAIGIKTAKSFVMPAKEVTVSASFKKAHIHSLTYTLSEDKKAITASCGAAGCTATDISLTLQAPANLTYDGQKKIANFGKATSFCGDSLPTITYQYKATKDGAYTDTTDTAKAGYYKASFTVGTGEGAKTAFVEYEITKAEISTVTYTEPTAPVSAATPASAISGCGTGYIGSISWSPADTTYKYNTIYTATVTLTADDNYKFSDNVTVPNDWTKSESSTAASLILTKTYAATAKAKLLSVTAPDSSRTLTSLYNDAASVIATLPTTATVTAEDGTTSLAVTWKLKDDTSYTNASSGTNTFTWSLTLGDLEANGKQITGDIVLTNSSHTHSWSYSLSEDKKAITAICGAAGCTATDTSLTIQAPANLTYDGQKKVANFGEATSFCGDSSLPTITYQYTATKDGAYTDTTDTAKVGHYKASFTAGSGEGTRTASVEYEVEKAAPEITSDPTASEITYGQTLSSSTLSDGFASVDGTFTWKDSTIAPQVSDSNTTEYTVVFTPKDSANYKAVDCTVKLTVNVADNGITGTLTCADIVAGGTPDPTGVSAKYGEIRYEYSTDGSTWDTWDKVNKCVGTYQVRAVVDSTENYKGCSSNIASFAVKESLKISISGDDTARHTDVKSYTVSFEGDRPAGTTVVWDITGGTYEYIGEHIGTNSVSIICEDVGTLHITATLVDHAGRPVLNSDGEIVRATKDVNVKADSGNILNMIAQAIRTIFKGFRNLFK